MPTFGTTVVLVVENYFEIGEIIIMLVEIPIEFDLPGKHYKGFFGEVRIKRIRMVNLINDKVVRC